jgi:hypothetical protein
MNINNSCKQYKNLNNELADVFFYWIWKKIRIKHSRVSSLNNPSFSFLPLAKTSPGKTFIRKISHLHTIEEFSIVKRFTFITIRKE